MTLDPKSATTTGLRNFGGSHDVDLARHDDDGWGGKGPPAAPADDDYFAASVPAESTPHNTDAHGRPSPAPAQGSPGAGPNTATGDVAPTWQVRNSVPSTSLANLVAPDDDAGNGSADPFAGLLALADPKSWSQSLTIRAVVAMAVTGIANKLGAHLDRGTVSDLVGYVTEIGFAVAAILAVIGRVRATRRIATPPATAFLSMLALCLLPIVSIGCATATPAFVRSERATQRIVAPTLAGVIDGTLPLDEIDADERASIHNTLDLWDANLRHAELATTRPTSP